MECVGECKELICWGNSTSQTRGESSVDIVEVLVSHTSTNLVKAFIGILMDYGISDKVSNGKDDRKIHISESESR